jgi:methionyl-tRNA formyltransferase
MMRVLFFGTPIFAADILAKLLQSDHKIVGAVCQLDKKGNRGKMEAPPIKEFALENFITVYQFRDVNKSVARLKEIDADIFVSAAYGQIFSAEVLAVPKLGILNVHPSLLPKYRGASPVQFALLNGDKTTGVTIAKSTAKLDAGDVLARQEIEINGDDTTDSLLKKTAKFAGSMLRAVLDNIEVGIDTSAPQEESMATYTTKITTDMCRINWRDSAGKICNQIRALASEPGAYTLLNGKVLKILAAESIVANSSEPYGTVVRCDKSGLYVKCGKGLLSLLTVQAAGGKAVGFKDFINGRKILLSDVVV